MENLRKWAENHKSAEFSNDSSEWTDKEDGDDDNEEEEEQDSARQGRHCSEKYFYQHETDNTTAAKLQYKTFYIKMCDPEILLFRGMISNARLQHALSLSGSLSISISIAIFTSISWSLSVAIFWMFVIVSLGMLWPIVMARDRQKVRERSWFGLESFIYLRPLAKIHFNCENKWLSLEKSAGIETLAVRCQEFFIEKSLVFDESFASTKLIIRIRMIIMIRTTLRAKPIPFNCER